MRKLFIIFLWLSYLPLITRGQNMEDPDLQELLQPIQAKSIGYWFDNDASNLQKTDDLSGSYLPDVSSLSDGMHTIHYLLQATDGTVSSIKTDVFVKTEEALSDDIFGASISAKSVAYWFDEDVSSLQTSNDLSGAYVINVSPLGDGLHTLHYVLLGNDGTAYSIKTETFIKMEGILPDDIIGTSVAAKSFAYWFDEDISSLQMTDDLSGIYVLDVSSLSDGLHTLHYHVVGADGNIYGTTTTMFLKDEEQFAVHEPNRITKYMYWLNHDNSTVRTVTLDQSTNPYTLISLLPLQRMPIRSSNFHFQIDDGVPTIYAKNDFNIRFYDSKGEFVDNFMENERTFIDYGVSQKITDTELLEPRKITTIEKPIANEIKWYYLNAEPGDSLEFKLDRAATIQLFSPSGKEFYKVSGAESVKWGGCHVEESGMYYLALHDVTAHLGTTISLDYNHIDKYDVLRQDVNVVGNGGCSTITFEGNGFRDLYAVDLFNEQGDSIHHVYLGHESDAMTSVVFDFKDAMIGNYNAKFRFTGEDKIFSNLIIVEEACDIELVTTIIYPSVFLRGTSTTFTTKTTNKGNQTAYRVPIHYIFKSSIGGISRIKKKDGTRQRPSDDVDYGDLTEKEKELLRELFEKIQNDPTFIIMEAEDEDGNPIDESHYVQAYVDIPPNSSVALSLTVNANQDVEFNYNVPTHYPTINTKGITHSASSNAYCNDFKDALDCLTGSASLIGDIASDIMNKALPNTSATLIANTISCGLNIIQTTNELTGRILCGDHESPVQQNFVANVWSKMKEVDAITSAVTTITKCAQKFIPAESWLNLFNAFADNKKVKAVKYMIGAGATYEACSRWYSKLRPVTSKSINSLDPNDIYGYTAESGNQAVKDGLTDVYFRIEFENDPEHATGPAHEIVVSDQLDAAKFDLSTFKPTRIEIGQKSAELTGDKNFVTTIDMRPEIYAIAQVKGTFDESTGMAKWHITSLDPMTMEPTEDPMNGVLPINEDGSGIGQILFDISLKNGLAHGTEIPNQATIIFDANEPITTPTWTNIVDVVPPASKVDYTSMEKPDTVTLHFTGEDEGSGVWRYTVYVQDGKNAPWREVGVTDSCAFDFEYAEGIDYGFCVLATDSAGNVERKELAREAKLHSFVAGDANSDGVVDTKDAVLVISYYLGRSDTYLNMSAADIVEDDVIDTKDAVAIINKYLTTSTNPKVKVKKTRKRIRVL